MSPFSLCIDANSQDYTKLLLRLTTSSAREKAPSPHVIATSEGMYVGGIRESRPCRLSSSTAVTTPLVPN